MVRLRVAGILAGGLLCLTGSVWAEPVPGDAASDAKDVKDNAVEVWGDPEANQDADPGWTWFGMGYERRMRGLGSGADVDSGKADAGAGANGSKGR